MRMFLTAMLVVAGLAAGVPARAEEPPYAWCALMPHGATNCGFETLQQCLANIYGISGVCNPNPDYLYYVERHRRSAAPPQR